MGKHNIGRRHRSGSYQELCNMMLQRLGGLDPDDEVMERSLPSFASRSNAIFGSDEIEVRWHESEQYDPTYVVGLGSEASVHLRPEDARELLAKLSSAMAERGDIVDYAALAAEAITALESVAHELNWNTNGRSSTVANLRETLDRLGYHAEPTGADEIDVVCDRERDAQIGVC